MATDGIIPVILSGGSGTRLWPLSRETYPKQFLALDGPRSLLLRTLDRCAGAGLEPPLVVAAQDPASWWPSSCARRAAAPGRSCWNRSRATPPPRSPPPLACWPRRRRTR